MQEQVRQLLEEDWKHLETVIKNHLLGLPGPTELNGPRTVRQLYVGKIFQGYIEILKSVDTLQLVEVFIGRSPARRLAISQDRYLQFFYEAYLHELYVLQQRLFRYLKMIQRQFRHDSQRLQAVKTRCKLASKYVSETLESVVKIRGGHVHVIRAYDKGIDRLGVMSLLVNSTDKALKAAIDALLCHEGSEIRRQWKRTIKKNNIEVGTPRRIFHSNSTGCF